MWIEARSQKFWVEQTDDTGNTVLFLHGFLMNGRMFQPQIEKMKQSHRCVSIDFRGFGKTVWDQKMFGLDDLAEDVFAVMSHLELNEPIRVVGMSQGGYVALRMAIKQPKRISHLVLLGTQSGQDSPETRALYLETARQWEVNRGAVIDRLLPVIIGGNPIDPTVLSIWDFWRTQWLAVDSTAFLAATNCLVGRDNISQDIQSVMQETLVLHGETDLGIPINRGKFLCDMLPNCKAFVPIEGAGHSFNLTHAKETNHAIQAFLSRN